MPRRRGLQKRVAEALQPMGFTAISGVSFTRQVGEQLHYVDLQYRRSCSEITFNLGCHFAGIPSLFDYREVGAGNLEGLDCGLRCRIGHYIGDGFRDVWWDPDNSEVPRVLVQVCGAIDRAFKDCMKKWGSDGKQLLLSHVKNRAGDIRLSRPLLRWMLPQWRFSRFAFVALLAHQHGNDALASAYCEKAMAEDFAAIIDYLQLPALLKVKRKKSKDRKKSIGSRKPD